MSSRPTLEQVAAEAGVAKSTASKVLNDRPNISPQTRHRVQEAMARLGYTPSTGPRAAGRARSICLVFRTLTDIYGFRVLQGVLEAARDHGVELVVDALDVASGGPEPLSSTWVQRQAAAQRAGVILVTSELSPAQRALLRRHDLPVVHIDPIDPLDGVQSVASTNFAGGMQAAQHLLDLGHRRIAFAGGTPRSMPVRERHQGYLAALTAGGGDVDQGLVRLRGFGYEAGVDMATELLTLPKPPTAIFAATDAAALGVLEAARRHGLRVPEDLSVVGFDDTYAAMVSAPALTTVRQPIIDMGRVAVRILLDDANHLRGDFSHMQLSTQLIVRESTAAPVT